MKIYKIAKHDKDKYYLDMELSRNPNTNPEILRDMLLEYRWQDIISEHIYMNPNCPPDLLEKVIEWGKSVGVNSNGSHINIAMAIRNPSCPIHIINEILKTKNFNDWKFRFAVENPNCPPHELEEVLKRGINDDVSWVAANNPNCPIKAKIRWMQATGRIEKEDPSKHIIEREEIKEDPDLQKLRALISNNKNWYKIAEVKQEDYITEYNKMHELAVNPKTSPEILEKIISNEIYGLSCYAVRNPNCPIHILEEIIIGGKRQDVYWIALTNPNCPAHCLEKVLNMKKNNYVSKIASSHKNCPLKAKIEWMQAVGLIGKEDPEIHIIEREEIKEDEDLKKLRALISKSKNWYKKAQLNEEDYYNTEIAKNPNCPPDVLKKILEKGNSDWVSRCASENPNCPSSALENILKQGKDDWVSRYAAYNPNCPPEALEMVLKRGKDDGVSRHAAENPNCPALAKIRWMQLTGKIGKEDPSKHIIEREEIKEDEDLKKLRALISKSKNWYKKAQLNEEDYYNTEIAKNPNTSPEILKKILEQGNDDWISEIAASNPNCPGSALEMVLKRGNDDWVSRSAAGNPNCTGSALEIILKRGKNDGVSQYAAYNKNCPAYLLEMVLKRGKYDMVSRIAANNPNCPASALEMVLKRGIDNAVSWNAAENPNCPAYLLEDILKIGYDDNVSLYASRNPNCPIKAKIKWMMDTGKIEKEDPSKHIIEREEIKEDEDLKKLRALISKSKNWYKKAQVNEDYYNTEIAANPNTSPEILKKILEQGNDDYLSRNAASNLNCTSSILEMVLNRGKDDWVSSYAASNPNCPAYLLEMVLKRGNDDGVSQYAAYNKNCPAYLLEMVLKKEKYDMVSRIAANNKNCPGSALEKILERGKDDFVSRNAASNPNCTASALEMVLKRGKDDGVSRYAAENPNCPALAKIRWMQLTGKIGKEDPSKHIIEREEIKEDEDLKKLRALISKSKNWYKKAQLNEEDYYNTEIAKNPNTSPEILKKILEQGNDDWISEIAASNPNCPGSALEMVLKRGNDDWVSRSAAGNPNCTGSALEIILKRGKNDGVSQYAAYNKNCPAYLLEMVLKRGKYDMVSRIAANNPNCPASALEMVLKRGIDNAVSWNAAENPNCPAYLLEDILKIGYDDNVSLYASRNPNCPIKAKIKWMMDTGKIEKEDPSKHIIEREEVEYKEDPDLQKLRALISKSNKTIKTAKLITIEEHHLQPIKEYITQIFNQFQAKKPELKTDLYKQLFLSNFNKQFQIDNNKMSIPITIRFNWDWTKPIAYYKRSDYSITINFAHITKMYGTYQLNDILNWGLEHEIIHVMQELGYDIPLQQPGALPKKDIQDPNYDIQGYKKGKEITNRSRRRPHPLREIEYFPNLNSIFNTIQSDYPEPLSNQEIKTILLNDKILNKIKANNYEKWKNAVSLLFQAIKETQKKQYLPIKP